MNGQNHAMTVNPFAGARLLQSTMLLRRELESNVSWTNALETMYFGLVKI